MKSDLSPNGRQGQGDAWARPGFAFSQASAATALPSTTPGTPCQSMPLWCIAVLTCPGVVIDALLVRLTLYLFTLFV